MWPRASLSPSLNQGLPPAPRGPGCRGLSPQGFGEQLPSPAQCGPSPRLPIALAPLWPSATTTYLVPPSFCRPRVPFSERVGLHLHCTLPPELRAAWTQVSAGWCGKPSDAILPPRDRRRLEGRDPGDPQALGSAECACWGVCEPDVCSQWAQCVVPAGPPVGEGVPACLPPSQQDGDRGSLGCRLLPWVVHSPLVVLSATWNSAAESVASVHSWRPQVSACPTICPAAAQHSLPDRG